MKREVGPLFFQEPLIPFHQLSAVTAGVVDRFQQGLGFLRMQVSDHGLDQEPPHSVDLFQDKFSSRRSGLRVEFGEDPHRCHVFTQKAAQSVGDEAVAAGGRIDAVADVAEVLPDVVPQVPTDVMADRDVLDEVTEHVFICLARFDAMEVDKHVQPLALVGPVPEPPADLF